MSPVIIYCSGSAGYELLSKIFYEIRKTVNIVRVIDFDVQMQGKYFKTYQIESPCSIVNSDNILFEYILVPVFLGDEIQSKEIIGDLCDLGIKVDRIRWIPMEILMQDKEFSLSNCVSYEKYVVLDYLEYKLCDHCNLNCRGCSHFANIVEDKVFRNYDEFSSELAKLRKLIPHIGKIRLLGGEPFLHPQIIDFVLAFRKAYPYSDIRICTNGLLLESLESEKMRVLSDKKIGIDISCYPPLYSKIDSIVEKLKQNCIFTYVEMKQRFKPILLPYSVKSGTRVLKRCKDISLYKGKLFPCPIIATIGYYNKYFGTKYPENNCGIDLRESSLTGYEILRRLDCPHELCVYCINWRDDYEEFLWKKSKQPQIYDWYPEGVKDE